MRKLIIACTAIISLVVIHSCVNLDGVNSRLDDLENRVVTLEELCKEMNGDISSLKTIVSALEANDYVTSVKPVEENGVVTGYTITFSKSGTITIFNGKDGIDGKDGKDGEDGVTPIIGVRQDSAGDWFWTLNGEWLLDEDGNKIRANGKDGADGEDGIDGEDGKDGIDGTDGEDGAPGKDGADGITPQLKIEEGMWYVSYDNGSTWESVGQATGNDGKDGEDGEDGTDGTSIFKNIDTSNPDKIVLTLSDDTTIEIPTWAAFETLRTLCDQINSNVVALQTIVTALDGRDYIISVSPISEGGIEVGYSIKFAKSGSVMIYHGKDGKDGENGKDGEDGEDGKDGKDGEDGVPGEVQVPEIGVKMDKDGLFYWTLNGEWLLDENGSKVCASGKDGADGEDGNDGTPGNDGADGITPQFKIENGKWFVSYKNGEEGSWTELGQATGSDSFFSNIDCSNADYVTFTLADGTVFKIPTYEAFEALRTLCNEINTNVDALQTIVEALQENDMITKVEPVVENGVETGYRITFANNDPITILHGKAGADGVAETPAIGVKIDEDGFYYWTLDGEWLLDDNGNKVRASGEDGNDGGPGNDGADGITPQFKIEDGKWFVSYDNGEEGSWTELGQATGDQGDSFFREVTETEEDVTFTLADGTTFTITKTKPFDVTFDVSDIRFSLGNSYTVNYTITGADARTSIQLMTSDGLKAKWEQTALEAGVATGIITVTMPKTIVEQSTVAVLVSDGRGKVLMKAITFVYEGSANLEDDTLIITTGSPLAAGAEGGTLTADVQTNMNYTIEVADDCKGWLTAGLQTKALRDETIEFIVAANTGGQRTGFVYLRDISDNSIIETICITQEGDPAVLAETVTFADQDFKSYILASYDINGDGELQKTEALNIESIDLSSKYASTYESLIGIGDFANLVSLKTPSQLSALDVSKNTRLEILDCSHAYITSLDLTKNIALKELKCNGTELTGLDLSNNTELIYLDCSNTDLMLLDVSNLTNLTTVICGGCQLGTLKTDGCSSLIELDCNNNRLASIKLSDNANLTTLNCSSNALLSLELSNNTKLQSLDCSDNKLSQLNLSVNAKLSKLALSSNLLSTIDLGNIPFITSIEYLASNTSAFGLTIKAQNLSDLTINGTNLNNIDITQCQNLTSFTTSGGLLETVDFSKNLKLQEVHFTTNCKTLSSVDLSANKELKTLKIGDNQPSWTHYLTTSYLTSLDVSKNPDLSTLYVQGVSNLTYLDLSSNLMINDLAINNNDNLTTLNLGENPYITKLTGERLNNDSDTKLKIISTYLEEIGYRKSSNTRYCGGFDLSECPNIKLVSFQGNNVESLTFSSNTKLESLYIFNAERLISLDIKQNTLLKDLSISNAAYMQSLDLSGNTGLTYLSCTGSSIASIDLSKNTELTEVYLSENKLTTLDVSPLTKLTTLDVSPMETLQTLYVGTAQSINYITYNRKTDYIPAATAIVTK